MQHFEVEARAFAQRRAELAERYEGQFAVFDGERLVGVWPDLGQATLGAARRLERRSFFLRPVSREPEVVRVLGRTIMP